MDLSNRESIQEPLIGSSDCFVVRVQGIFSVNELISNYRTNYILHSISEERKRHSNVLHYVLLFHRKALSTDSSVAKELEKLNKNVEKLIEITRDLSYRV